MIHDINMNKPSQYVVYLHMKDILVWIFMHNFYRKVIENDLRAHFHCMKGRQVSINF